MREWLARLRDWFRREQLDRELREELEFHRTRLERDAGEGDAEERGYAARRRLGNLTRIREQARERWSWPWLDSLQQDVRYALRGLRRSPGFTATVVLTLGLGIGANAAMFGVLDRLMLRPFPYLRDAARVHRVFLRYRDRDRDRLESAMEYTRYLDIQRWAAGFDRWAGFSQGTTAVGTGAAARERQVGRVSGTFFGFFDARPALGRFFGPAEDVPPVGAPVVVLSYPFWQSEYGGRDVVGQPLQVGSISATIIGVAPRGFIGLGDPVPPDVYLPITTFAGHEGGPDDRKTYYTQYHWGWMGILARRNPGTSIAAANAGLSAAYRKSWEAERAQDPEITPAELARPAAMVGSVKSAAGPEASLEAKTLRWVMGVAVIVLLIACANVANLMLARVLRRRRETAVRLALGVSRGRLLRQAVTESLLLALLGCGVGLLIAELGGGTLRRVFVDEAATIPVLTDWRTLGVAIGFALLAGLFTGLGSVLFVASEDLAGSLKSGAREGTYHRSRARSGLLVIQGALSVVLLVGAGLFVRSLNHVRRLRLGYEAEPVLLVMQSMRGTQLSDSQRMALGRRLLETGRAFPGVEHASLVSSIPFWSTSGTDLYVAGIDSVRRLGRFTYQTATTDYFATMGTRILRGRGFSEADRAGAPRVAVISEAMGAVLWPGRDPLGQCMRVGSDTVPCTTVVGIAENAAQRSLVETQPFRYYLPLEQFRPERGWALLLRMRADPAGQAEPVRRALQPVMPGQSYVTAIPLDEVLAQQRRSWQAGATMFVAFGALALVVAAVGLYGVIGYNVAQRTHELGVRIALGAQARDVVRLVVGQGIRFATAGVGLGLLLALVAAKWIQPLLFQQPARDPLTYGVVAGVLVAVALAASALPARRATRADPNSALRSD